MKIALIVHNDKPSQIIAADDKFYESNVDLSNKYSDIIREVETYREINCEIVTDKEEFINNVYLLFESKLKDANIHCFHNFPVVRITHE